MGVNFTNFSLLPFSLSWPKFVLLVTLSNSETPWTVACQALQSMGFSRQECWEWVAISFSRGSSWSRQCRKILYHLSCRELLFLLCQLTKPRVNLLANPILGIKLFPFSKIELVSRSQLSPLHTYWQHCSTGLGVLSLTALPEEQVKTITLRTKIKCSSDD